GVMYDNGYGLPQDYVGAHMWFNLTSANGFEIAGRRRDKIAVKMTPAEISEAQRRAQVCVASNYQDCD
ncbi:MAG: sel1 repeat family protein, partial [Paracoccaceae bacterium]